MSLLKKVSKIAIGITMASLLLVGCGGTGKKEKENIPEDKLPVATIEVKNFGTIEAELYPNKAPNTVDNFISLANNGFCASRWRSKRNRYRWTWIYDKR